MCVYSCGWLLSAAETPAVYRVEDGGVTVGYVCVNSVCCCLCILYVLSIKVVFGWGEWNGTECGRDCIYVLKYVPRLSGM